MKVKTFVVNQYQTNSYIYYDENSNEGVIIDPGFHYENELRNLNEFIENENISVKYILNTHGHIDHIIGNNYCSSRFNAQTYLNRNDWFLVDNILDYADVFGFQTNEKPHIHSDLSECVTFKIGTYNLEFIHTPGHSPGSMCIINHKDKFIFCGDLIFRNSIGRTDLPGGNFDVIMDSIKIKLFGNCSNDYLLYPGHMEKTSVSKEKKTNQFLI